MVLRCRLMNIVPSYRPYNNHLPSTSRKEKQKRHVRCNTGLTHQLRNTHIATDRCSSVVSRLPRAPLAWCAYIDWAWHGRACHGLVALFILLFAWCGEDTQGGWAGYQQMLIRVRMGDRVCIFARVLLTLHGATGGHN